MPEPVRVFVSYAHQDHAFAKRLVGDLPKAGAEVWWDVLGIDEGDFLDKINDANVHERYRARWLLAGMNYSVPRLTKIWANQA